MKPVRRLSQLRNLLLYETKALGDPALDHIVGLKNLRELELGHTSITDAGSSGSRVASA